MPQGVVCLALAGGLQVSTVRIDKVFRDPGPSTASVPRCRCQTSLIAGTVLQGSKQPMRVWFRAMHLLGQGKKGISNIELGRRLGISTNAAWRLKHKLMQAQIAEAHADPQPGAGPRHLYAYLWHHEHEAGREEGQKDQPSVMPRRHHRHRFADYAQRSRRSRFGRGNPNAGQAASRTRRRSVLDRRQRRQ
jgi:hypothetical protein